MWVNKYNDLFPFSFSFHFSLLKWSFAQDSTSLPVSFDIHSTFFLLPYSIQLLDRRRETRKLRCAWHCPRSWWRRRPGWSPLSPFLPSSPTSRRRYRTNESTERRHHATDSLQGKTHRSSVRRVSTQSERGQPIIATCELRRQVERPDLSAHGAHSIQR